MKARKQDLYIIGNKDEYDKKFTNSPLEQQERIKDKFTIVFCEDMKSANIAANIFKDINPIALTSDTMDLFFEKE